MATRYFGGKRVYFVEPSTTGSGECVQAFRRDPFRHQFQFVERGVSPILVEMVQIFRRDPFRRRFWFQAPSDTPPPVPIPTGGGSGSGGGRRQAFDFDQAALRLHKKKLERTLFQIITIVWLALQPKKS